MSAPQEIETIVSRSEGQEVIPVADLYESEPRSRSGSVDAPTDMPVLEAEQNQTEPESIVEQGELDLQLPNSRAASEAEVKVVAELKVKSVAEEKEEEDTDKAAEDVRTEPVEASLPTAEEMPEVNAEEKEENLEAEKEDGEPEKRMESENEEVHAQFKRFCLQFCLSDACKGLSQGIDYTSFFLSFAKFLFFILITRRSACKNIPYVTISMLESNFF